MAITFVGKGASASSIDSITVAVPSGYASGDLLILMVETANQAVTTPSGWTNIGALGLGDAGLAAAVRLTLLTKIAGSSESSVVVADSGDHTTGVMSAWRGVDTTTPIHNSAAKQDAATESAKLWPTLNTTIANCMIVSIIALDRDANSTATMSSWANSNLTSITEGHDQTHSTGNGGGLSFAYGIKSGTGAAGATTATSASTERSIYSILALNPYVSYDFSGSVTHSSAAGLTMANQKDSTSTLPLSSSASTEIASAKSSLSGVTLSAASNLVIEHIKEEASNDRVGSATFSSIADMSFAASKAITSDIVDSLTSMLSVNHTKNILISVNLSAESLLTASSQKQGQSTVSDNSESLTVMSGSKAVTKESVSSAESLITVVGSKSTNSLIEQTASTLTEMSSAKSSAKTISDSSTSSLSMSGIKSVSLSVDLSSLANLTASYIVEYDGENKFGHVSFNAVTGLSAVAVKSVDKIVTLSVDDAMLFNGSKSVSHEVSLSADSSIVAAYIKFIPSTENLIKIVSVTTKLRSDYQQSSVLHNQVDGTHNVIDVTKSSSTSLSNEYSSTYELKED